MPAYIASQLHWGQALRPAPYHYGESDADCPAVRPALAGTAPAELLPGYTVRTPSNYDPRQAHPLLVVFSPAGIGRGMRERISGLTNVATAQGLIVAYVDSLKLSRKAVGRFAQVVSAIAAQWCVDPSRITVAGHSDGGTVAELLALLDAGAGSVPAAIVASGAGLIESDFAEFRCVQPVDVTLFHGRDDHHFPGYGASAARGWADCLGCAATPALDSDGCLAYSGCRGQLRYCELPVGHWRWPPINDAIVAKAAARAAID
ncbi:carboxylesterase family protein [Sinimarinibacterium sp. CAU 1509]|uniref:carboxylesterase family protein n=1 Tax=Sinimarinibacterium sp. CAU 1509 TaxID=2562283 RepID=UPI00146E70DB|nr:carboxylesterase family protein [Sinimarinibacterium sp. CAU 1509]